MKRIAIIISFLLLGLGAAQTTQTPNPQNPGFVELESTLFTLLRVADVDCSQLDELDPPENATCYVHGYETFFDFKEAFFPFMFQNGVTTQTRWRLEDGRDAIFTAQYQADGDEQSFVVVFGESYFYMALE